MEVTRAKSIIVVVLIKTTTVIVIKVVVAVGARLVHITTIPVIVRC